MFETTWVIYKFIEKVEGKWCISLKKLPAITVNKEYLSLRKQIPLMVTNTLNL
jgi:hypothetical protein